MATEDAQTPQTNGEHKGQKEPYAVSGTAYTGEKKQLRPTKHKHIWIVTGPAGCGKTTVASFIAGRYGMPYLEGDTFHPPANIAKMAAGHPLDDSDRWGWLARVRDAAVSALTPGTTDSPTSPSPSPSPSTAAIDPPTTSSGTTATASLPASAGGSASGAQAVVVTCSALKKSYRDILRAVPGGEGIAVRFVYLALPEEVLFRRVRERVGHYMKESMVRSQIEVLEEPDEGEVARDTLVVRAQEAKDVVEGEVGEGVEKAMGEDEA